MTKFKRHDSIRIIKQPPNQVLYLQSAQGFIEKVSYISDFGQMYMVRLLNEYGQSLGVGKIPEDCLLGDTSPASTKAKNKYLETGDCI